MTEDERFLEVLSETYALLVQLGDLKEKAVRAKREQRPAVTKDCFDLFVFVKLMGVAVVNAALDRAPQRSAPLREQLAQLFWDFESPGVCDVVQESGLSEPTDRELLAREVVDLFAAITAR